MVCHSGKYCFILLLVRRESGELVRMKKLTRQNTVNYACLQFLGLMKGKVWDLILLALRICIVTGCERRPNLAFALAPSRRKKGFGPDP